MTKEEAIKILGLPNIFTKDDLKKAYRRAAMKCHPDMVGGKKEDFQKVNEANEILERSLNTNNSSNDSFLAVVYYADNTVRKIYNYVDINIFSIDDTTINTYVNKIKKSKNKEEIDKWYKYFLNFIVDKYKEYEIKFKNTWKIPASFKYTLNYNCRTSEFLKQLEKVKKDYYDSLQNILRNELSKYYNWYGYSEVEEAIKNISDKYFNKILNGYFKSSEQLINDLNKEIKSLFDGYFLAKERFEKLEILKRKIINLKSICLLDHLQDLTKQLGSSSFAKDYQKLEDKIDFISNKKYIDVFNEWLKYYSNAYSDNAHKQEFLSILQNIVKMLISYSDKGMIDIDSIMMIKDFTFEFEDTDIYLINYILNNIDSNFQDFNYNYIYIDKNISRRRNYEIPFELMIYEDKKFYMNYLMPNGKLYQSKLINKKFLDENYISLREFLLKATFVGKSGIIGNSIISVLYELEDLYLIRYNDGIFDIVPKNKIVLSLNDYSSKKYLYRSKVLLHVKEYLKNVMYNKENVKIKKEIKKI